MIKFFSKKTPLYIFDLDGTLALIDHRRHLVETPACPHCEDGRVLDKTSIFDNMACPSCGGKNLDKSFKPDWPKFFKLCKDDKPNWPVITTLLSLKNAGCEVWIWSGRSDEVKEATKLWLNEYLWIAPFVADDVLKMRTAHDYTPDDQLKESWLNALSENDRARLAAVFDDRQKVVDMWRRNGVACFQVAPGDF